MKIYESKVAPNPRRVRMFLAEKGLLDQVAFEELDLQGGDNLTPEFAAKNPMKKVPVLELDDGTCIAETMAICRYFEELHPEPPLMGRDPLEKAHIEQWLRWIEFGFFLPTGMCFQHTSGYFKDRMNPIKEWGEECRTAVEKFFHFLNKHLEGRDYICGEHFSAADINAFTTVDFNKVNRLRIQPEQTHLQAWYDRINSRDSARV
ncbi:MULTISPECIES: glutathione S-transferase family protein [Marinobacter]|uniref:Glutathione S-transferase family protein n=1 Tax=Marinobacter xestospongiae TaxID=994319 RepID=A0ABU3VW89_9GAMM|nr:MULTISPECIES: glutathione S-transferase family protein [Marinobacter]MCK7566737.1 glutathione S-transferase family protein [Marinobacter xestospongiae]MDV2078547.1 glutathione S-transferase family protein [Marinobacter xestospongiae]UDL05616.1 glutathione S-transferase family protein [Marinobacter sp. CA1]